jgi:hypothetical protein
MKPVASSNIEAIGYDHKTRVLSVKFKTGSIYKYEDVSPEHYEAFMAADSKGEHLAQHIRGKFIYTRHEK